MKCKENCSCKRHQKVGKPRLDMIGNKFAIGHKPNSTSFEKGFVPWNKNKRGLQVAWNKGITMPRISERMKGANNPHYGKPAWNKGKPWSEEIIKKIVTSLNLKPSSYEKRVSNLIHKYNLPYKYTGDGSFLIGYKNPDFININSEKNLC